MNLLLKAARFAAERHTTQRRKDEAETPYINHPIEVAETIANDGGVTDEIVLAAALLHDTVEDTGTTPEEIEELFGREIRDVVMEVTDDKSLETAERKRLQIEHARHISVRGQQVKLGDKIANLRSILVTPPTVWDERRMLEYFVWAKKVIDGVRGANSALEEVFDRVYTEGMERYGDV